MDVKKKFHFRSWVYNKTQMKKGHYRTFWRQTNMLITQNSNCAERNANVNDKNDSDVKKIE